MPMPTWALSVQRSHPQTSDTYLIIQQPEYRTPGLYASWTGYEWSCQINGIPAGDPVTAIQVDNGDAGPVDLLDGMTVMIGSEVGGWDKAIVRLRGDQTVNGATVSLDIAPSSDLVGIVEDDDYVVVLDEFRLWQRYGYIDYAGGVTTWYKDYTIAWTALGANDAARRLAMMPPRAMMQPHAVAFLDEGESVDIDFDWSDSYAPCPGEAVDTWASWGETDHVGGTWNDNVENPAPKTYSAISGLQGFRVVLEVDDGNGNATTLPFRRGVRYVFTLRRPGQRLDSDPWDAEPIIDFDIDPITSSFQQGYARTRITIHGDAASRYEVIPGALVVVFTDDYYAAEGTYLAPVAESVGPIPGRENVLFIGRISNGTVEYDPETESVSFEVISTGEETTQRRTYPIVVNYNAAADNWIDTPSLTVDRAMHYYTTWHTTLPLITNVYQTGDATEIKAQDFMEGDIYTTINSFLSDRLFARLLFDRYGQARCEIDVQMDTYGTVDSLWVLAAEDWLDRIQAYHVTDTPCSYVELGGVSFVDNKATPYMSGAPGAYNKYHGTPSASRSLAVDDQDDVNTLSGRLLAYKNCEWVPVRMELCGNWRTVDVAPQEAIVINSLETERGVLDGRFIIREVTWTYDKVAGAWFTSVVLELETDGPPGQTIAIPETLPRVSPPYTPRVPVPPITPPPGGGGGSTDDSRRMIATDIGVFCTDDIFTDNPVWYGVNDGFVSADDLWVSDIKRDPHHWWTSGGTERTLYAATRSGVWKHENFPDGTWVQVVTDTQLGTAAGVALDIVYHRIAFSIEVDGLYASVLYHSTGAPPTNYYAFTYLNDVIQNAAAMGGGSNYTLSWPSIEFAQHSGGNRIFVVRGHWDPFVGYALYRTINRGGAWAAADGPLATTITMQYSSLAIPYVDAANPDNYLYWGYWGRDYRQSVDGGASFADYTTGTIYSKIGTGYSQDHVWLLAESPGVNACRWTNDRGTVWTDLPMVPAPGGVFGTFSAFGNWTGDQLDELLVGGMTFGDAYVYQWKPGFASWEDKSGNLRDIASIGSIHQLDRDSMGTA